MIVSYLLQFGNVYSYLLQFGNIYSFITRHFFWTLFIICFLYHRKLKLKFVLTNTTKIDVPVEMPRGKTFATTVFNGEFKILSEDDWDDFLQQIHELGEDRREIRKVEQDFLWDVFLEPTHDIEGVDGGTLSGQEARDALLQNSIVNSAIMAAYLKFMNRNNFRPSRKSS